MIDFGYGEFGYGMQFGYVLVTVWLRFGYGSQNLVMFWLRCVLVAFWLRFGYVLVTVWLPEMVTELQIRLLVFWLRFGYDVFWLRTGLCGPPKLAQCQGYYKNKMFEPKGAPLDRLRAYWAPKDAPDASGAAARPTQGTP